MAATILRCQTVFNCGVICSSHLSDWKFCCQFLLAACWHTCCLLKIKIVVRCDDSCWQLPPSWNIQTWVYLEEISRSCLRCSVLFYSSTKQMVILFNFLNLFTNFVASIIKFNLKYRPFLLLLITYRELPSKLISQLSSVFDCLSRVGEDQPTILTSWCNRLLSITQDYGWTTVECIHKMDKSVTFSNN